MNRYAFRSEEKVALQEIGPRFTLKLKWLKQGIPSVKNLGSPANPLVFDEDNLEGATVQDMNGMEEGNEADALAKRGEIDANDVDRNKEEGILAGFDVTQPSQRKNVAPPTQDEFIWQWKPELETTRRTFFL